MFPNANVLKMHLKFYRKIECSSCHNKIYLATRKNVYFFSCKGMISFVVLQKKVYVVFKHLHEGWVNKAMFFIILQAYT